DQREASRLHTKPSFNEARTAVAFLVNVSRGVDSGGGGLAWSGHDVRSASWWCGHMSRRVRFERHCHTVASVHRLAPAPGRQFRIRSTARGVLHELDEILTRRLASGGGTRHAAQISSQVMSWLSVASVDVHLDAG